MRISRTAAFAAALLAFGSVLPGSVQATDPDATRCPGRAAPLCAERSVTTCARWYLCSPFARCCSDENTQVRYYYFPGVE